MAMCVISEWSISCFGSKHEITDTQMCLSCMRKISLTYSYYIFMSNSEFTKIPSLHNHEVLDILVPLE